MRALLRKQKRYSDLFYFKLEKSVFSLTFLCRKLFDSYKISDEIEWRGLNVVYHPIKPDVIVDIRNWIDYHEIYNLDEEHPEIINPRKLFWYIIHSFIFLLIKSVRWNPSENEIDIYVSSDRTKDSKLYKVPLWEFMNYVELVSDDDVRSIFMKRDEITKEMKIVKKSNA